jgi:D-glycero-D-manno-heptose 1,7-bisphosphate phosphatase
MNSKRIKTVIMAGGKGTRLASIASGIPKPMVPLAGKPILEYQLECLKNNGLTDIIIVVGHLGGTIKDYFGNGSAFGVTVSYYSETEPLGTAGALFKIIEELDDDFVLVNGDIIFDIDFSRLIDFHLNHKAWATLAVHPNSHPYDSALVISDSQDRVIRWLNKEEPREFYKNRVNSGIHVLSRALLAAAFPPETGTQANKAGSGKIDLDREILKPLVDSGPIFSYHTPEYIKDIGTPERYALVEQDIKNGLVSSRNLSLKQKAVFLDRDGTINRLNGFVTRPEDFVLIEGAAEAIGRINRLGYLAIVITNQPVIARGEASLEDLENIHNKMETELGKAGAYIDDIFFCPHHPDRGFPGERPEYKIGCDCRKPKPGLLLKATEKYNIDLGESYMVGDDMRDVNAGIAAGCKTALLKSKAFPDFEPEKTEQISAQEPVFSNLREFTESVLQKGAITC